ncbi:squalene epoxidase-domain-containing protein [Filobasidium floriforme]|uniref:squalene epoxidase-domain-containing protein n=1 Tax=Filobasidium floriforme TaxID=5210 RepID=UPI001E8E52B6|nr:squalene epoxidase-domain-containing protein [Filobasidium floriforme]KAH8089345.1 squalene epoxidase-domain-containing protein [Filobasidium floriforme]
MSSAINHTPDQPDIIIIGAGIAGCGLAYSLSHTGHRVLLIERDLSPPDRIVGELLQPGGVAALRKLGMGDCLEGIDATPVEGYCVYMQGKEVPIPYPTLDACVGEGQEITEDEKTWSRSGKKEGRSFHHGRFIDALRRKVIKDAPGVQVLEGTVSNLVTCDHTTKVIGVSVNQKVKVQKKGQEAQGLEEVEMETVSRNYYAPLTIIADGCFSKFRKAATQAVSPKTPSSSSSITKSNPSTKSKISPPTAETKTKSHFIGLVIKDVHLPKAHHGTVCLTPAGPVLLYQIADEARETRLLVDVKGKLPSISDGSMKTYIEENYLPHLPPSTQGPIQQALSTDQLRKMPNSFLPPKMQGRRNGRSGVIMVGDSWNMRHPLTGGGMTVAFSDAVLLTKYLAPSRTEGDGGLRDLHDWEEIRERLQRWYWERKNVASVVNILSIALYDLFGADDANLAVLRDGCFAYFELGGDRVAGPVGLLSALTPKPLLLFYHFFSVAFYSIYILFTRGESSKGSKPGFGDYPALMVRSGQVFWTACVVLLPVIWSEVRL